MTTSTPPNGTPERPFWWQNEDGAVVVRKVWAMVEELVGIAPGVDASVRLSKPGEPRLTIAFDWDVIDDEGGDAGF